MTRNLVLILGDQLNIDNPALADFDISQDHILMVEVQGEATHVWSHKARIVLFLSAMRHFAESLIALDYPLTYLKIDDHAFISLQAAWQHYIALLKPQTIIVCELGEYRVEQALIQVAEENQTDLTIKDDTHFMCSRADFKRWANAGKQLRMEFFYRMMRKKYQILMLANDQPEGGAWNFDADNRKPFTKTGPQAVPQQPMINIDTITQQVIDLVNQLFPNHPGSLSHFVWPVNRLQALDFLDHFITHKLVGFGEHQDAMWQSKNDSQTPYLWHSLLSTSLNLKLLNSQEVVESAVKAYKNKALPLASVEGFIRQILGWREFIRGMYWLDMPAMAKNNYFNHTRALPDWYWTGETKMNCQRQTIMQTMQYGYAHHIQRLMITGMFGVLAELNPREVEAWYLAVYVDAVEWVELPNVTGMALYANGGRFTSKPYIASGAYIKRMSNYCAGCQYKPEVKTGPQACPITTLYWHFLIKHYDEFSINPRTALMTKNVDRFSPEALEAIQISAEKLLQRLNTL